MNWQLGKITGTKDSIGAKLKDAKIPQSFKDVIASEVASLPGESAIITVTGYSADHHSNPMHPTNSTRNIEITVSSVIL